MNNFGTLLKKLRSDAGLTQKDFASKLNTTDTTVSSWENNKRLPDIPTLRDISQLLDVTYDELLNPTETLEKLKIHQNSISISKTVVADKPEPITNPIHFSSKCFLFLGLTILFLVISGSIFVIHSHQQTQFKFMEARTNVETSYGPAYELVYCINTKASDSLLLSHSDSLAEAWKIGTYNDCDENVFVVSYYLSVQDISNWDNIYFQAFTFKNTSQQEGNY